MIYITGDTHGLHDVEKLRPGGFPIGEKLSRKDYLIIAGDFGGIWYGDERDNRTLDFYKEKKYTVLFIDGNHENFYALNHYPTEKWNGGKIHRISENIIHLMRGQIYDIEGNSFFTFGGGLSIDKNMRIPDISWWKEEWPTKAEMDEALDNLEAHENKVNFVITHAAPQSFVREVLAPIVPLKCLPCDTERFLDEIYNKISFEQWFCGHYHFDAYVRSHKMYCLYNDIVEFSEGFPRVNKKG